MSLKEIGENKAGAPLPRELVALKDVTAELLAAITVRHKERAAALIDEVENGWRKCNILQLRLSAEGGHADLLVELAASLNAATDAKGRALFMASDPGYGR